MTRIKQHIAVLLFGIFFLPILFQYTHIIWHHFHCCKCKHNHCYQLLSEKDFNLNCETLSIKEKTCLICDYQFSISDLPGIFFFRSVVPIIACNYNEIVTEQQYKHVILNKSPRASPVYFS